ncbi:MULTISPECIES: hypothetical protein [unclassified Sphingomonas]|jgi:hypothetical protein|uniref:hypothetical protein n=1 Tax=unclassified Sphingomonas TaxID=196159 RepID=UPI00035D637F|nr:MULTISPECIES: hypothetical protein [unclassified Sphingomonas]
MSTSLQVARDQVKSFSGSRVIGRSCQPSAMIVGVDEETEVPFRYGTIAKSVRSHVMNCHSYRTAERGTGQRLATPLAVWMFVVLLLFSAVAPLGPPETLRHGAAFNPATTSVAITAKRGDKSLTLVQRPRAVPLDSAIDTGALLPHTPAFAAALAVLAFLYLRAATPLFFVVRRGAPRARAPPRPPTPSPALQRLRA